MCKSEADLAEALKRLGEVGEHARLLRLHRQRDDGRGHEHGRHGVLHAVFFWLVGFVYMVIIDWGDTTHGSEHTHTQNTHTINACTCIYTNHVRPVGEGVHGGAVHPEHGAHVPGRDLLNLLQQEFF